MKKQFDCLVEKDLYQACLLFHGTTEMNAARIEDEGINLCNCRRKTDFNGARGFYVTADYGQAYRWAKVKAKKDNSTDAEPDVVYFEVDREELVRLFNYKRFNVGEYNDWLTFTTLSRSGIDNEFDIVEGPYKVLDANGNFSKPKGHQLGIFSEDVARYFDDHNCANQLSSKMEKLSFS